MNITITNETLTATINPKGAELNSLQDNNGTEYIWEGNPDFWGKHSPVLFPVVGTLKHNTYTYNNTPYTLTRHGFARDRVFTVKQQTQDSVTFSLASDTETKKAYPFDFELQLKYTLTGTGLKLDYTVINTGNTQLPFSLGAHPAFALPGDFSSYALKFEKDEPLVSTQLENDLISDKTATLPLKNGELPLSYRLFDNDALIFKTLTSNYVDILKDGNPLLRVSYYNFPHLGIWTKDQAPFICIEPWQGYSDSAEVTGNLTDKEGIILLDKNTTFDAGFAITVL